MWRIGQAITKKLWNRFELESLDRTKLTLSDQIYLVENVDKVLRVPTSRADTISVTGNGALVFPAVPADEQWTLEGLNLQLMSGGFTFEDVRLYRTNEHGQPIQMILNRTAGKSDYQQLMSIPYAMPRGSYIGVDITGYAVAGTLRCVLHYQKETLF